MFRSSWLKDILLLTLITSLFFGAFLGTRNLSAPDELRYSEIPREMIVDQDYLIPKLNGVKYFEKPPLFYWMQVASIKNFGLNEWSLRLATALMGLLGVLATYLFSRRLYDRKTGWLAALILSSMTLYSAMAHVITLDMAVSVFIIISLYLFYLATRPTTKHVRAYVWGAFIAAAAAMMTKGLIGIIFPAMIGGLWTLIFQRWRQLKYLYLISGAAIFILLAAPWHILVQLKAPEFFNFYFIEQQFLRYATENAHRYHSPLFYVPVILLGTLPWVCFLPQALHSIKKWRWKNRFQYENEIFFTGWSLFIILFFSTSNSKLIPYVLPALSPLAILCARYFVSLTNQTKALARSYISLSVIYIIGAFVITFLQLTHYYPLPANMTYVSIPCLIMALAGFYGAKQKTDFIKPIIAVYLAANILLISAVINTDYFDNHTVKPLVMLAKERLQPSDEVIAYHGYYQDLPFYLQHPITVNESFDELSFGAKHANTQRWMIHEKKFKQRWFGIHTIYLFISKKNYKKFVLTYSENKGWVIAQDSKNLMVVNHLTEGAR
ncbi:MAG: glycosyltransferase family 39 protein [Gammaproteobacteria bacterium]|nr:glycosyltransferase family 39 protein [Gammaproteobacteria bacterium]